MQKVSKALRLFFLVTSIIILIGIWLTGFNNVHWFSYVVPAFLIFAAITGFCPGMEISKRIMSEK